MRVTFEGEPVTPCFLIPATERTLPATLAEWERLQAAKQQARERSAAEQEKRRKRLQKIAQPVTVAISGPALPGTLRGMVASLLGVQGKHTRGRLQSLGILTGSAVLRRGAEVWGEATRVHVHQEGLAK